MFTLLNITQANSTLVAFIRVTGTMPATIRQDISTDTFSLLLEPTDGGSVVGARAQTVHFIANDTIKAVYTLPPGIVEIVFVASLSVNDPSLFATKVDVTQNIKKYSYISDNAMLKYV
jgi:hypothetical protein